MLIKQKRTRRAHSHTHYTVHIQAIMAKAMKWTCFSFSAHSVRVDVCWLLVLARLAVLRPCFSCCAIFVPCSVSVPCVCVSLPSYIVFLAALMIYWTRFCVFAETFPFSKRSQPDSQLREPPYQYVCESVCVKQNNKQKCRRNIMLKQQAKQRKSLKTKWKSHCSRPNNVEKWWVECEKAKRSTDARRCTESGWNGKEPGSEEKMSVTQPWISPIYRKRTRKIPDSLVRLSDVYRNFNEFDLKPNCDAVVCSTFSMKYAKNIIFILDIVIATACALCVSAHHALLRIVNVADGGWKFIRCIYLLSRVTLIETPFLCSENSRLPHAVRSIIVFVCARARADWRIEFQLHSIATNVYISKLSNSIKLFSWMMTNKKRRQFHI